MKAKTASATALLAVGLLLAATATAEEDGGKAVPVFAQKLPGAQLTAFDK